MNETVKQVIEAEKARADKDAAEQKKRFLIDHGVFRKEYDDNGDYYDEEGRFNKIPLEVTDEEYDALLEVFPYDTADYETNYQRLTYESVENIRQMVKFFVVLTVIYLVIGLISLLVIMNV